MCRYGTVSTRIHSGAIVLSRLGVPPGRHALDIEAVGLVTGQLDRLPSRGECKKVIRCDIYFKGLVGARKKEIETEDHLKKIAEREEGRLEQEIQRLQKEMDELKERKNIYEVGLRE